MKNLKYIKRQNQFNILYYLFKTGYFPMDMIIKLFGLYNIKLYVPNINFLCPSKFTMHNLIATWCRH